MYMYLNGSLIESEKAAISPFDHGYLYGLGVFETFRTYSGAPFLLKEHVKRLNDGLMEMGIKRRFDRDEVLTIVQRLSELNQLPDSYIRMNVSAGVGEIGLQTDPYDEPTIILFQKELPPLESLCEKAAVVLNIRRNTPEINGRLKSHHFFNNVAAKRELGPDPGKEGIFLSEDGFLAEGVTSNLFWVRGGCLFTPALETGILNGITRQFILKLAKQIGLPFEEGLYRESNLEEAEEIFFTNSIQEIVPVSQFQERRLPGKKGSVVEELHRKYKEAIHR